MVPLLEEDARVLAARAQWQFTGKQRPSFAHVPEAGQESVWDYPRPPRVEPLYATVEVRYQETLLAKSDRSVRVLETAGAPTVYIPPDDIFAPFVGDGGSSVCEWKGLAEGLAFAGIANAGWRYIQMFPAFKALYQWVAFYPGKVECFVGDERVRPQPGGYYGGWVTDNIVGPIKGEPGING